MPADLTTLARDPPPDGEPTLSDPANEAQPLLVGWSNHQKEINPAEFRERLSLPPQRRNLPRAKQRPWALRADAAPCAHFYCYESSSLVARKEINF